MILFYDFPVVDKLSVDCMKYNLLQLKIYHSKGIIQFGSQVKKFNFLVFIILNAQSSFCFEDDASVHGVLLRVRML